MSNNELLNQALLLSWYLLHQRLSLAKTQTEPAIVRIIDEIARESQGQFAAPNHKEVLPMMLYRDLIRERWVWRCKFE